MDRQHEDQAELNTGNDASPQGQSVKRSSLISSETKQEKNRREEAAANALIEYGSICGRTDARKNALIERTDARRPLRTRSLKNGLR